jgi:hypothetical protein
MFRPILRPSSGVILTSTIYIEKITDIIYVVDLCSFPQCLQDVSNQATTVSLRDCKQRSQHSDWLRAQPSKGRSSSLARGNIFLISSAGQVLWPTEPRIRCLRGEGVRLVF